MVAPRCEIANSELRAELLQWDAALRTFPSLTPDGAGTGQGLAAPESSMPPNNKPTHSGGGEPGSSGVADEGGTSNMIAA